MELYNWLQMFYLHNTLDSNLHLMGFELLQWDILPTPNSHYFKNAFWGDHELVAIPFLLPSAKADLLKCKCSLLNSHFFQQLLGNLHRYQENAWKCWKPGDCVAVDGKHMGYMCMEQLWGTTYYPVNRTAKPFSILLQPSEVWCVGMIEGVFSVVLSSVTTLTGHGGLLCQWLKSCLEVHMQNRDDSSRSKYPLIITGKWHLTYTMDY